MANCEAGNDLLSGALSHVANVAKQRTGKRPAPATVWRWCKVGLRGGKIRVEAIYHSGYWQTTPAAFDAFLKAQTEAALVIESANDVSDEDLKTVGLL